MPMLTACFCTQQGGNGGQEENREVRMNRKRLSGACYLE